MTMITTELEDRIVTLTSQLLDRACECGSIREELMDFGIGEKKSAEITDVEAGYIEIIGDIEDTLLLLHDELDDLIVLEEEVA
jgi:hypothetical protein